MKRRFFTTRDYMAGIGEGDCDWAVYDRRAADTERPLAVFARRSDAYKWAADRNRPSPGGGKRVM